MADLDQIRERARELACMIERDLPRSAAREVALIKISNARTLINEAIRREEVRAKRGEDDGEEAKAEIERDDNPQ
jgi:hypothetical protein